jgi:cephalosporin-C deacetylase
MPFFDMPLEQLQTYQPPRTEAPDFDQFWAETLDAARKHSLNAIFTPYDSGMKLVDMYDVTFNGYGGQPIKGWYLRPAGVTNALPCVVEYIGYGGGRGLPTNWLFWSIAGYAHLVMDTRGQGSAWSNGDTPDIPDGANPSFPGFMTQGIFSPQTYYYRRVYTDAVRAIEAARSREDVDGSRILVTGGSQGGGITIAAAALVPDVAACMPDVAFLCHFRRATTMIDTSPYNEIARFLQVHRQQEERVFNTLSYFDGMNLAARIKSPSLFSAALMDMICPPSTIFAAYNQITAPKEMRVYNFNGHEGGGSDHAIEKLKFAQTIVGNF